MNIIEPRFARQPHSQKEAEHKYTDDCYIDCCEERMHYHRAIGIHEDHDTGWTLVYHCEGILWHCYWAKGGTGL